MGKRCRCGLLSAQEVSAGCKCAFCKKQQHMAQRAREKEQEAVSAVAKDAVRAACEYAMRQIFPGEAGFWYRASDAVMDPPRMSGYGTVLRYYEGGSTGSADEYQSMGGQGIVQD